MKQHLYQVIVAWTGNLGEGTPGYRSYERSHDIHSSGKPTILGSSDPAFRGDPTRYNPEELFVASLSACHMLGYLHLCAVNGISVIEYRDEARGTMSTLQDGTGSFVEVVLQPRILISATSSVERATELHEEANRLCFIAQSVNFPVRHEPSIMKLN